MNQVVIYRLLGQKKVLNILNLAIKINIIIIRIHNNSYNTLHNSLFYTGVVVN